MSKVQRFYLPGLDCAWRDPKIAPRETIPVVLASDYDALAANNKRLREALVELMRVMPCLPSAAKQIDGMPDRYYAAIKSACAALADSKEGGVMDKHCKGCTRHHSAAPQHDAELVELLRLADEWVPSRGIAGALKHKISTKLATLSAKNEGADKS